MTGTGYHLVFRGEVLEGQDRSAVARRLAVLLKLDAPKVRALFSGKPVVLKRDVPKDVAARYQAAFRDAGARLRVTAAEGTPATPPRAAPEEAAAAASAPGKPTLAQRLAAEEAAASAEAPAATSGRPIQDALPPGLPGGDDWAVTPAEGDLIRSEERPQVPPVAVDVGHLSAAPANTGSFADVVPPPPPPPPAPDTSGLEVDAPGVDLAPPRHVPELELDLSALTLAEPGADLGADRRQLPPLPLPEPEFDLAPAGSDLETLRDEPPPPPPDVSHLKLE